jgi:hypothetical protein
MIIYNIWYNIHFPYIKKDYNKKRYFYRSPISDKKQLLNSILLAHPQNSHSKPICGYLVGVMGFMFKKG